MWVYGITSIILPPKLQYYLRIYVSLRFSPNCTAFRAESPSETSCFAVWNRPFRNVLCVTVLRRRLLYAMSCCHIMQKSFIRSLWWRFLLSPFESTTCLTNERRFYLWLKLATKLESSVWMANLNIVEELELLNIGQIHGSWGGCALIPSVDQYKLIEEKNEK